MLLNFSDRTRTGVFNMVWPLTSWSGQNGLQLLTLLHPQFGNCAGTGSLGELIFGPLWSVQIKGKGKPNQDLNLAKFTV